MMPMPARTAVVLTPRIERPHTDATMTARYLSEPATSVVTVAAWSLLRPTAARISLMMV